MELCPHIQKHLDEIDRMVASRLGAEDESVYGIIAPFLKRGGKKLRPALCLLSCGIAGGKYQSAVESAAIIEIVHNVTLIHDDIEDGSKFRRGEPTMHSTYGMPTAMNSGDALYNFAWDWMLSLPQPAERILKLQRMYAGHVKRMVLGQGMEIMWRREGRFNIGEREYLEMVIGKTASLMELSCGAGAFFADAGQGMSSRLSSFGRKLGTAFQIHDDVLNLTGDFRRYRKEIGGDIHEGKRTLMVAHCLENANEAERSRLKEILQSRTTDEDDIQEAIGIMKGRGSLEYAKSLARKLADEAKAALGPLEESEDKKSLLDIADYSVSRDR
ncbi:MAG: polyprenyl synthetase family protein [Candidatus Micrarchaeota archaeon]